MPRDPDDLLPSPVNGARIDKGQRRPNPFDNIRNEVSTLEKTVERGKIKFLCDLPLFPSFFVSREGRNLPPVRLRPVHSRTIAYAGKV